MKDRDNLINQLFMLVGYATGVICGMEIRLKEEGINFDSTLVDGIRKSANNLLTQHQEIIDKE